MKDKPTVEVIELGQWELAYAAAMTTVNKPFKIGYNPTDKWKRKMLAAEHSPIRLVKYAFLWKNVPKWVTTHYVRHHEGIEKFVGTQRTDRTGSDIPRGEHPQGEPTNMMVVLNAQAMLNISRVRLCNRASKETRELWQDTMEALLNETCDDPIVDFCVPRCVHCGFCPEFQSCGYVNTDKYQKERKLYLNAHDGKQ